MSTAELLIGNVKQGMGTRSRGQARISSFLQASRLGDETHPKAMAVLMSDGQEATKWMDVRRADARFVDLTEHVKDPVFANAAGWVAFLRNRGSVSVRVES